MNTYNYDDREANAMTHDESWGIGVLQDNDEFIQSFMSSHEVTCLLDPYNDTNEECYAKVLNLCNEVQMVESIPKCKVFIVDDFNVRMKPGYKILRNI